MMHSQRKLLSDEQLEVIREYRVASGWRKAGTPRPPRRSLKYLGVREALVTAGDTRPYLPGRRYVIVLPFVARKEELAHGISLRTLLWGAEFKNEAVARDVLRAFQTGGTIAVADLVPTTSIFGSATFNRVGVKSIEVAA
jgi:hypothetical protein